MFRSLALGGGGVRAGLQVGALAALEHIRGPLTFPDGIWGCSAGSVLATAVAFNLTAEQIRTMYMVHMNMSTVLPPPRLESLADLVAKKGLFTMDRYEATLLAAFKVYGIDLATKTIADAPQPLYIVASNLTTHNPTVFTKQVRILDAIRCSSCIPLLFQPEVLYNNVYVDGGLFVDCLDALVGPDTLVLHISDPGEKLYASELETISLTTYLYRVYRSTRGRPASPNVLWLRNSTVGLLQDLTLPEREALLADGDLQTRTFLTKRLAKEGKDVLRSSLSTVVQESGTGL
jgi:hypothetical protein